MGGTWVDIVANLHRHKHNSSRGISFHLPIQYSVENATLLLFEQQEELLENCISIYLGSQSGSDYSGVIQ